jgi:hypothetical protein
MPTRSSVSSESAYDARRTGKNGAGLSLAGGGSPTRALRESARLLRPPRIYAQERWDDRALDHAADSVRQVPEAGQRQGLSRGVEVVAVVLVLAVIMSIPTRRSSTSCSTCSTCSRVTSARRLSTILLVSTGYLSVVGDGDPARRMVVRALCSKRRADGVRRSVRRGFGAVRHRLVGQFLDLLPRPGVVWGRLDLAGWDERAGADRRASTHRPRDGGDWGADARHGR